MNKAEFIEKVAEETGLAKKHAGAAVEATIKVLHDAFAEGEKVTLSGLGSFETRPRAAREGRNPQTGEPIQIEARHVPAFSPGKVTKEKAGTPHPNKK